jgi:hypothetical protein
MTAAELIPILQSLPPNSQLVPNTVGNIAVGNEQGQYIGYIDFRDNSYNPVDEDDTATSPSP